MERVNYGLSLFHYFFYAITPFLTNKNDIKKTALFSTTKQKKKKNVAGAVTVDSEGKELRQPMFVFEWLAGGTLERLLLGNF